MSTVSDPAAAMSSQDAAMIKLTVQTFDGNDNVKESATFVVKRSVLTNISYFRAMLNQELNEANQETIMLKGDSTSAWKAWLHILKATEWNQAAETLQLNNLGLWNMLAIADKYGIDPGMPEAQAWFENWYQHHHSAHPAEYTTCQELLFPCYAFNHAGAFLAVTKTLVYNGKLRVSEKQPQGFGVSKLHVAQRVIQQLNAARGRLRVVMHHKLYAPIRLLMFGEKTESTTGMLWDYHKALSDTKVWPMEGTFSSQSINDIVTGLAGFVYTGEEEAMFKLAVQRARAAAVDYFDGLCLDCMENTKHIDKDADYWDQLAQQECYDSGCRVNHGQPTWWFSFCGRYEQKAGWSKKRPCPQASLNDDSDQLH